MLTIFLILKLLSSIGTPSENEIKDMMVESTKMTMESIRLAADIYYVTYFHYAEIIEDLIEFLEPAAIPLDAWGNPIIFRRTNSDDVKYFIFSYGADGKPGGIGYDADIIYSRDD
ncbi:MAG: type II secretion system protein GspG [Bacteroidales bacterium]|nr:type II secretion system protein GspG [Bacteroidales bacterium]